MHVLLIEDDTEAARFLVKGLRDSGHTVEHAADGRAGLGQAASGQFDVVITDRMLPHVDGLAVIEAMRARGIATPVLVLSALGGVDDRIRGLKAGGDDYLTKPFAFAELVARIKALARRPRTPASTTLKVGDLEFDTVKRRAKIGEHNLNLSPKEKMLLELLMRNAGQVVTRDMIAETVWDSNYNSLTNLIEVFVNRLRQKIDPRADRSLIVTVRGVGYTMRAE